MRRLVVPSSLVGVLLVLTAACGSDTDAAAPSTTASTATTAPPTSVEPAPTTVAPQPAAPGCPPVPARATPDPDRPRHELSITVDVAGRRVVGTLETAFTPDLGVDRLVYRLWPNGPRPAAGGARLAVTFAAVDGRPVQATQPSDTLLEVPVSGGRSGAVINASIGFELTVPGSINDRIASGDGWMRLGSFYPTLEWQPGVGWNTEPATSAFAESSVAPTADYVMRVRVSDEGLAVLASGEEVEPGVWRSEAVRDVALTVGRLGVPAVAQADAGRPVEVVVAAHDGIADAGRFAAKVASMLEGLAERYGAYPWPRYTLGITPGLSGGIEYPGHVLQGPATLGRTTTHEIAHMWFYGLVGNHQGLHPWLDEGFATWGEAVLEKTVAKQRSTAVPAGGRGRLGAPMTYWEPRQGIYYRSVYVQGAQALGALGEEAVVDCVLAHHVARHAHRIATPEDFVAVAESVVPEARAILGRFGIPE